MADPAEAFAVCDLWGLEAQGRPLLWHCVCAHAWHAGQPASLVSLCAPRLPPEAYYRGTLPVCVSRSACRLYLCLMRHSQSRGAGMPYVKSLHLRANLKQLSVY